MVRDPILSISVHVRERNCSAIRHCARGGESAAIDCHAVPFKSQAQRRKFAQLLVEGKISPQTFEEWNRETGSKRLPQHVAKRKKRAVRKRKKAR